MATPDAMEGEIGKVLLLLLLRYFSLFLASTMRVFHFHLFFLFLLLHPPDYNTSIVRESRRIYCLTFVWDWIPVSRNFILLKDFAALTGSRQKTRIQMFFNQNSENSRSASETIHKDKCIFFFSLKRIRSKHVRRRNSFKPENNKI